MNEAIGYLRGGSELGFGSLADPGDWLPRLSVPESVLSSAELLAAATLMDAVSAVRQTFTGEQEAAKHPLLTDRAAALADFRHLSTAIRRAVMPNGEISDDASPQLRRIRVGLVQAREKIQRSLEDILRARGEPAGRGLHHAAQRPLRDSGARVGPARGAGRGACGERHGADRFRRAARSDRSE